jgi:transcriptional regulator with XRE-family HTH domain
MTADKAHRRLLKLLAQLRSDGMTQRQISKKVGVCQQYLSDVKHKRKPLTALFAFRLAEAFKLDPKELYHTSRRG